MSNLPSPSFSSPEGCNHADRWENLSLLLQQCDEAQLRSMLLTVQMRLGTDDELPDDMRHAQAIGHWLSNYLMAIRLQRDSAKFRAHGGDPSPAHGD